MFLPYKDINPTKRFAFITLLIIGLNVFLFVYPTDMAPLSPAALLGGEGGFLPLLTYMFMHGSPAHLIFNMLFLWVFGNNIEDAMSPLNFLVFYILTGVLSALAFVYMNQDSPEILVGASGAVSAILGAYVCLFPFAKIHTLFIIIPIKMPAIVFIAFWFAGQIFGFVSEDAGNVAWICHIAGFVSGVVLYRFFIKREETSPSKTQKQV